MLWGLDHNPRVDLINESYLSPGLVHVRELGSNMLGGNMM